MNYMDLELYRWKYHHDIYLPSIKKYTSAIDIWWQEYGAFVSTVPRQSGKTNMLGKLAYIFDSRNEYFMVVVPTQKYVKAFVNRTGVDRMRVTAATSMYDRCFDGIRTRDIHLLIDEYQRVDKPAIRELLNHDWKTVTMAGTMLV